MTTHAGTVRRSSQIVRCADGLPMALDLFLPAAEHARLPVTVLCHGFKGFRSWGLFPHLAARLAESGRAVAIFDLSHNGVAPDSPEDFTRLDLFERQTPERHVADLGIILDVLSSERLAALRGLNDNAGIHVVGHSLGGGLAVMAAADDHRIAGVVTLNGISHFGRLPAESLAELETADHVSIPNARTGQIMPLGRSWFDAIAELSIEAFATRVRVPTVVIQGDADTNVTPDEGAALASWIPGARLVSVPGGDHTFGAKHPWQGWTEPLRIVAAELDGILPRTTGTSP